MSDAAFDLLASALNSAQGSVLWLVDENVSAPDLLRVQPRAEIVAISNRFDIFQQLISAGFNASLADFNLQESRAVFDMIAYRVSKEKALVHHIINHSADWLKNGGRLFISGFKGEGIKTYSKKAQLFFGSNAEVVRGQGTARLIAIERGDAAGEVLDDKSYSELRQVSAEELDFYSKPGLFGWQKVDQGSAFLIEQLPSLITRLHREPGSILDLGCGYGYLGIMTARLLQAKITAVDNNIAAVAACRKNFQSLAIDGEVFCDDCGSSLIPGFDWILCNPPFHQGFDVESELTRKFIASSHRLLKPGGNALFVVNAFIGLERMAANLYDRVEVIANNKSFKVLMLSR